MGASSPRSRSIASRTLAGLASPSGSAPVALGRRLRDAAVVGDRDLETASASSTTLPRPCPPGRSGSPARTRTSASSNASSTTRSVAGRERLPARRCRAGRAPPVRVAATEPPSVSVAKARRSTSRSQGTATNSRRSSPAGISAVPAEREALQAYIPQELDIDLAVAPEVAQLRGNDVGGVAKVAWESVVVSSAFLLHRRRGCRSRSAGTRFRSRVPSQGRRSAWGGLTSKPKWAISVGLTLAIALQHHPTAPPIRRSRLDLVALQTDPAASRRSSPSTAPRSGSAEMAQALRIPAAWRCPSSTPPPRTRPWRSPRAMPACC